MSPNEAMEQLDAIHVHLTRTETFHGYRPQALALSGLVGLVAGLGRAWFVPAEDAGDFVRFWVVVALACGGLAGGATLAGYFLREDEFRRRRTRTVLSQFAPCLFAGAVLTRALAGETMVGYLPGIWALVYGLGIVASLPYLPRATGLVAAWFLGWGMLLLLFPASIPAGWTVAVPFGLGQMLAAGILARAEQEGRP